MRNRQVAKEVHSFNGMQDFGLVYENKCCGLGCGVGCGHFEGTLKAL